MYHTMYARLLPDVAQASLIGQHFPLPSMPKLCQKVDKVALLFLREISIERSRSFTNLFPALAHHMKYVPLSRISQRIGFVSTVTRKVSKHPSSNANQLSKSRGYIGGWGVTNVSIHPTWMVITLHIYIREGVNFCHLQTACGHPNRRSH